MNSKQETWQSMENTTQMQKQSFTASFKELRQVPEKQLTGVETSVFPVVQPSAESHPEISYLLS